MPEQIAPAKPAEQDKPEKVSAAVAAFLESAITGEPVDLEAVKQQDKDKKKEQRKPDDSPEGGKPEVKPAAKPQRPRVATQEDLARAAGEGATKAILESQRVAQETAKKPAGKGEDDEPKLGARELKQIDILRHMENMYGEKYKGVADKYRDGLHAVVSYRQKWEAEHPGETFDESSVEHTEFFNSHQVEWDDEDFIMAVGEHAASVAQAKADREWEEKMQQRLKPFERKDRIQSMAQQIDTTKTVASKKLFEGLSDVDELADIQKVLKDDGTVDMDYIKELDENPQTRLAADIVVRHFGGGVVEALAEDAFRLMNDLDDFDPKNKRHVWLSDFLDRKSAELQKDEEKQFDANGKAFATAEEWTALSEEERETRWTFTPDIIAQMVGEHFVDEAKKVYKAEKQKIERYSPAPQQRQTRTEQPVIRQENRMQQAPPPADDDDVQDDDDGKPVSPSLRSEPVVARGKNGGGTKKQTNVSAWLSNY